MDFSMGFEGFIGFRCFGPPPRDPKGPITEATKVVWCKGLAWRLLACCFFLQGGKGVGALCLLAVLAALALPHLRVFWGHPEGRPGAPPRL